MKKRVVTLLLGAAVCGSLILLLVQRSCAESVVRRLLSDVPGTAPSLSAGPTDLTVCWEQGQWRAADIVCQRFDLNGFSTTDPIILTDGRSCALHPRVATAQDGQSYVVYQTAARDRCSQTEPDGVVYLAIIGSDGLLIVPPRPISPEYASIPVVAVDRNMAAHVVWYQKTFTERSPGSWYRSRAAVRYARVNANGSLDREQEVVGGEGFGYGGPAPDVAVDPAGNAYIAFRMGLGLRAVGITLRRLSPEGLWRWFGEIVEEPHAELPRLMLNADNRVRLTYLSRRHNGSAPHVFAGALRPLDLLRDEGVLGERLDHGFYTTGLAAAVDATGVGCVTWEERSSEAGWRNSSLLIRCSHTTRDCFGNETALRPTVGETLRQPSVAVHSGFWYTAFESWRGGSPWAGGAPKLQLAFGRVATHCRRKRCE
jgi:hypothetical protein